LKRALAIVVLCALGTTAHADTPVVGLLDVRGDGVNDEILKTFSDAIEEGLDGAEDLQPAKLDRMREMLAQSNWSPACSMGPCLTEVQSQTGADYVVVAGVFGSGESYRFTITLLDTAKGQVVGQDSEGCPACTVEDLASAATLATIQLVNGIGATPTEKPQTSPEVAQLRRRVAHHAALVRRGGVLLLGVGLLAAGAAAYFHHKDQDDVGYPLLGATAGLAVSGVVMLGISFRF
jgi:hypothetical protein